MVDERDMGTMYDFVGKTPKAWAECVLYWLSLWRLKHPGVAPEVLVPMEKRGVPLLVTERLPGVAVRLSTKVKPAYFFIREAPGESAHDAG